MDELKVGDKVEVLCDGLASLRRIMGPDAKPNHHGEVHEIWDDGSILVAFPIGDATIEEHSQVAPYHPDLVRLREERDNG